MIIKIKLDHSQNTLQNGIYEFHFDKVYIGSSLKSDLILSNPNTPALALIITQIKNDLIALSVPKDFYYLINEKKMSGLRKLNINDKLKLGEVEITILDFTFTQEPELHYFYEEFKKNYPDLQFALDYIEEKIIQLENEPSTK